MTYNWNNNNSPKYHYNKLSVSLDKHAYHLNTLFLPPVSTLLRRLFQLKLASGFSIDISIRNVTASWRCENLLFMEILHTCWI